jgi:N-acetylglucosaminyl-diphospho-decaprenol L-rhamnosyltransferase
MKVSVIIVSWNTRELLQACLASLYQSLLTIENEQLEVWVVDNASSDGSAQMVHDIYPQVNLIVNTQNPGFGQANNQAIRESSGDYVWLLNPDTEVLSGAIEALITYLELHPESGAVGSMLLNKDRTRQNSCYPFPTLRREFWRLFHLDRIWAYGVYNMESWSIETNHPVDVIQGASLMFRRIVLDQVGFFDESYFMYTEEVDLCYRTRQAGWLLYWIPASQVIHFGGQSTSQVSEKMFLCLYQSKVHFFRKHYGNLSANLYKMILFLISLGRLVVLPLSLFETSDKRIKHRQLANNYRLLIQKIFDW